MFKLMEEQKSNRILIADDHEMLLELFSLYLQSSSGNDVVTVNTLDEALAVIRDDAPFSLALLDWNMPGMLGVHGLRRVMSAIDPAPVAILTAEISPRAVNEVLAAGAAGIVLKASGIRSLNSAIDLMLNGERYLPVDMLIAQRDIEDRGCDTLSAKEMEVLREIAKGRRNKEICGDLQLALPTVKMYISALCRKLGAKNRLHATVIARDLGIL